MENYEKTTHEDLEQDTLNFNLFTCDTVQVPYFPSQSFPRETGGLRKATQGPQALGSFVSRRLAQYQVWMTFSNIFWISETETFLPQPTALQNSDMSLYNEKKIIESSD